MLAASLLTIMRLERVPRITAERRLSPAEATYPAPDMVSTGIILYSRLQIRKQRASNGGSQAGRVDMIKDRTGPEARLALVRRSLDQTHASHQASRFVVRLPKSLLKLAQRAPAVCSPPKARWKS